MCFITAARACVTSVPSSTSLFGESYLGYLSLVLLLPFAAYGLFKRFLPGTWAIALAIGFVAIPIGELFGTTFIDYAKWAARGFADPAAYIFFITGLWVLIGARPPAANEKFTPALFGALLLALAHRDEADCRAGRRHIPRRRRPRHALFPAMAPPCRHVHRLPAGVLDGAA